MIVSWILILFFLLIIIGEMYFIGKYISVTQEIFSNKTFATFMLGAAVYIFATFLLFIPFVTIGLSLIYFAIIIVIKDFFTIIFLISRREKFRGTTTNWVAIAFAAGSAVILPIVYEFVVPHVYNPLPLGKMNDYETWSYFFVPAFTQLTKFQVLEINRYMMAPLASIIVYSSVASLFLNFYKKNQVRGYVISFVVTILFLILFNYHQTLYEMIGPALVLFMFLVAYNLIMFSRRRYGSLFGVLVGAAWSVQPHLFWTILILAFASSITYSFLKKPKALMFTVMLTVPVLIVAAFWFGSISRALALTLAIIGVVVYIVIFTLNRFRWLESNNKWITFINYAWPVALITTMIFVALGYGLTYEKVNEEIIYKHNTLFETFDNDVFSLVQNVMYYVLFLFLAIYTVVLVLRKDRVLKLKLVVIITLFTFLFGYNPAFQAILTTNNWYQEFQYARIIAIAPIAIVATSQIKWI